MHTDLGAIDAFMELVTSRRKKGSWLVRMRVRPGWTFFEVHLCHGIMDSEGVLHGS